MATGRNVALVAIYCAAVGLPGLSSSGCASLAPVQAVVPVYQAPVVVPATGESSTRCAAAIHPVPGNPSSVVLGNADGGWCFFAYTGGTLSDGSEWSFVANASAGFRQPAAIALFSGPENRQLGAV